MSLLVFTITIGYFRGPHCRRRHDRRDVRPQRGRHGLLPPIMKCIHTKIHRLLRLIITIVIT